MDTFKSFESKLYSVNDGSFVDIALALFRYQARSNPVYAAFIRGLSIPVESVTTLEQIPYFPITLFKHFDVKTGDWQPAVTFTSSGTTQQTQSRHLIPNLGFYLKHAQKCFAHFFGDLSDYRFLALLPSYLERDGSSLIAMMDYFVRESGSSEPAFYLDDINKLRADLLSAAQDDQKKIILWGVSFALLEMAQSHPMELGQIMVFETGGMKGRGKEITRAKLHHDLCSAFGVERIHSEYGMTELLSQAYTRGGQQFFCPPWMRVVGRDLTDPLQKGLLMETAGINVIDLANWHSIAFIETEDLGIVYADGTFEVLGRLDNSDVRGCNLLIS